MTEAFDAVEFIESKKSFTQGASAWEKKLVKDSYERGRNDGLEEAENTSPAKGVGGTLWEAGYNSALLDYEREIRALKREG